MDRGNVLRVALGQLEPTADLDRNLSVVAGLAAQAGQHGAQWFLLPEYGTFLHGSRAEMERAAGESQRVTEFVARLAHEYGFFVLLGSLVVSTPEGRMVNRSILFDGQGHLIAKYDKLHMFDVELPDGRLIRESKAYDPGNAAVLAKTALGCIGLSICYDLRFPQLYRQLSQAGAQILVVPSAFARATGEAHWRTLLTARAIENGAYVLAPATCGESPGGRATHGHTMIVDPWGDVVGELGSEPGCLVADLDLAKVSATRAQLPSLRHDRPFDIERISA